MTPRRALGDLDVDSAFDDPDNGWFGHVRADPTSSRNHADVPSEDTQDVEATSTEDTDRWPVLTVDPTPAPQVDESPPDDLRPSVGVSAPGHPRFAPPSETSWESRLSGSGAWDFKASAASGPRYRSKLVLAAMIAAASAVAGAVFLARSPGPAGDDSRVVSPRESIGQPAPSSTAPALSTPSGPALPPSPPGPPPPPPPPPIAEEISPPVVTRDYTPRRQNAPADPDKPEIGVTRAPATRTQMSATPPPPPAPDRNSSTPGDGPKRNGFGF